MTRPAELVLQEVKDGLLSAGKARRSYGVAVDEASSDPAEAVISGLRVAGVEALSVCFMHSPTDP